MRALTVPSSDIDAAICRIGATYSINDDVVCALGDSDSIATGISESDTLNYYIVRAEVSAHFKSVSTQVNT
jgi:hypothetical protein